MKFSWEQFESLVLTPTEKRVIEKNGKVIEFIAYKTSKNSRGFSLDFNVLEVRFGLSKKEASQLRRILSKLRVIEVAFISKRIGENFKYYWRVTSEMLEVNELPTVESVLARRPYYNFDEELCRDLSNGFVPDWSDLLLGTESEFSELVKSK